MCSKVSEDVTPIILYAWHIGRLNSDFSSVVQSCPTLCDPVNCSMPAFPVHHQSSWNLLKLMSIESVMPSNHLIISRPLLLLPSIFASIRVVADKSWCDGLPLRNRWPKYGSFSFNISPSSEYSVTIQYFQWIFSPSVNNPVISFRMDWLDLLAVQGTLKSLLQHHSSKASILRCSAFFMVQLSHPYMTLKKP